MLTISQKYLIELSRAAVFDEDPAVPPEGVDWKYIFDKANEQNIAGLVASAVLRLPDMVQTDNSQSWNDIMMQTMFVMGKRFAEFEKMMGVLKKNGIEPICLKGAVIKDLYPVPELRTMGDFDVLIEKEERKSVKDIFGSMGYEVENRTFLSEMSNKNVHWEVFTTLEEEFNNNCEHWESMLRENVISDVNGRLLLNPTYEFLYVIVHMAKHFVGRGCGLRNILDIVLAAKFRYAEIDFDAVYRYCDELGIDRIFEYIVLVLDRYFDIRLPLKMPMLDDELFMDYILSYGIYGRDVDGVAFAGRILNENSNGSIINALFPSFDLLKNEYSYLKKSKLLLPVAWVHRAFRGIFVKKLSLGDVAQGMKQSAEWSEVREQRLKKLGVECK